MPNAVSGLLRLLDCYLLPMLNGDGAEKADASVTAANLGNFLEPIFQQASQTFILHTSYFILP